MDHKEQKSEIFTDNIKSQSGKTKYISIPHFYVKKLDLKFGDTVIVKITKIE